MAPLRGNVIPVATAHDRVTDQRISAEQGYIFTPLHLLPFIRLPQQATMGKIKECKAVSAQENDLQDAKEAYLTQLEPSICHAALTYHVPYGTL